MLDKTPEINNYLTVRNCYKLTRVGSKSTSRGIFDWLVDQSKKQVGYIKIDTDIQVSETTISRPAEIISRLQYVLVDQ